MSFISALPGGNIIDRILEYRMNRLCPNQVPDPGTLMTAYRRGALSEERFRNLMKSLGYSDDAINAMLEASKPLPTVTDLMRANARGVISDQEYINGMKKLGYTEDEARKMLEASKSPLSPDEALLLYRDGTITKEEYEQALRANGFTDDRIRQYEEAHKYRPSPQDLVTFAVREALDPETAQRLGLYQDIPPEFLEEAKKLGMDEETAKMYWASHWKLPGVEQVLDMYHRGILGEGEEGKENLRNFLKAADYSPYWRDKIEALSYNPYTRVDASRMYLDGQITEEELYKNYRDLGYDDEKARTMVEYWKKQKAEQEAKEAEKAAKKAASAKSASGASSRAQKDRDISLSLIRSAYYYHEVSRDEAKRLIMNINFEEWEAELTLTVWDAELKKKDMEDEIKLLEESYSRGLITEDELRSGLNQLGLKAAAIDIIVVKNSAKRNAVKNLPSLADLKRWAKKKIITKDEFINWMQRLNYTEELAYLYYAEVFGMGE